MNITINSDYGMQEGTCILRGKMSNITKEDMEHYQREQKEIKAFVKWKNRINKNIPELAKRVFDLRGKSYNGCGFSYDLEGKLGKVINIINDYDRNYYHGKEGKGLRIVSKVIVEGLFKQLATIEKEIRGNTQSKLKGIDLTGKEGINVI
jgi:hypothetical protein